MGRLLDDMKGIADISIRGTDDGAVEAIAVGGGRRFRAVGKTSKQAQEALAAQLSEAGLLRDDGGDDPLDLKGI